MLSIFFNYINYQKFVIQLIIIYYIVQFMEKIVKRVLSLCKFNGELNPKIKKVIRLYCNISNLLIEKLENNLKTNRPNRSSYEENFIVIKYLNSSTKFNPFNETWDDSYYHLNLLKSLYFINFKKNKNNK